MTNQKNPCIVCNAPTKQSCHPYKVINGDEIFDSCCDGLIYHSKRQAADEILEIFKKHMKNIKRDNEYHTFYIPFVEEVNIKFGLEDDDAEK